MYTIPGDDEISWIQGHAKSKKPIKKKRMA
jgi:hypothetical protein